MMQKVGFGALLRVAAARRSGGGARRWSSQQAASPDTSAPTSTSAPLSSDVPPTASTIAQPDIPHDDASSPFQYIKADLECVAGHIAELVAHKENKVLDHAAKYLLQNQGKMLRPAIVALSGYAAMPGNDNECTRLHGMPMLDIMKATKRGLEDLEAHPFNRHLRLAEVTELVHTASLIHDDVLDEGVTRRGRPALHSVVGTKVAVLTGDYLLARASNWLSTLGDPRVVMAMSQALEDLTVGEIMQMEGTPTIDTYLQKSFCKTASLIAHSCRGAAILSNPSDERVHDAIYRYGKHIGLAFQIVDDNLDFTATEDELGKPALNDLKSGVVTLPVLLAARQSPEMKTLLDRNFCLDGDVDQAVDIIKNSEVIPESQLRAKQEIEAALDAIKIIPESCAKESMVKLTEIILTRRK